MSATAAQSRVGEQTRMCTTELFVKQQNISCTHQCCNHLTGLYFVCIFIEYFIVKYFTLLSNSRVCVMLSMKCPKIVKNAHHNFPEPKVASSNCFFVQPIVPNSIYNDIQNTKYANCHVLEAGTSWCFAIFLINDFNNYVLIKTLGDTFPGRHTKQRIG